MIISESNLRKDTARTVYSRIQFAISKLTCIASRLKMARIQYAFVLLSGEELCCSYLKLVLKHYLYIFKYFANHFAMSFSDYFFWH